MLLKPQPQFVVYWVVQAKGVQNSVLVYIYCASDLWLFWKMYPDDDDDDDDDDP